MPQTVCLISLGCAKNLVNSEQMLALLAAAGYAITPEPQGSDAVVVNTCAFIGPAKQEAIDTILELAEMKKSGEIAAIVAAGCLAERYRDEVAAELPEVDAFVGVGAFGDIVSAVQAALRGEHAELFPAPEACDDDLPRALSSPGAWAYLKIADGCDNRCAFCVVPSIRGKYRSRREEEILREARDLAASGVRELIVIAQDTTRYGVDLYGEKRLAGLLHKLSEIDGILWIRLHYLYPDGITDELVREIAENPKILKYLDIPIQHINDEILRKMRRRTTGAQVRELITRLRRDIPGLVLRTSLIAGLPGEGDAEFEELCEFLKEAKFERAGIFAFSPEEGTAAYDMEYPDNDVALQRAAIVEELQSRIMDDFNDRRVGTTETVLVEGVDNGWYYGRSFAESPEIDGVVVVTGGEPRIGEFVTVKIVGSDEGDAVGEMEVL
ncbi:MAG: 30S ribosomal protein S12 methylthiotransferase RimO [Oscillospiraceae bacterium]|jgi:ribosomal protein S12 methylthiotransferase|nr:30S ribosomal protein S12 methylthiotransferase RimO [Oscillospiraceae bacterium]